MMRAVFLLALVGLAAAQFQQHFQFDDMFQGQQGGGGGGQHPFGGGQGGPKEPEQVEKGYLCSDTKEVVDHPRQCPCPGHKMVKCKLDDWYVCYPSGHKCPEGKFSKMTEPEESIDDYDEE
eukprot:m.415988 g.415988  ORF g.415988 m.415988 type:complete len:121 (+) comp29779_c0_seq1:136-498(+)